MTMDAMAPKASDNAATGRVPNIMTERETGGDGDAHPAVTKPKVDDTNTPLRLTRKNLALLNSLNGDNGGGRHNNDENRSYFLESDSDTMRPISTTTSGFEETAYQNGILNPATSHPRQSLSADRHYCTQRRTSTQPSEHAHQQYCEEISTSSNEATASITLQTDIMKKYRDYNYSWTNRRAITRIPAVDFNRGLSNPQPDRLEGLKTKVLPHHLHDHVLHVDDSLAFCHFAAEFKRTDGNFRHAVYQAAYDGATMVYARDRALTQARASALDGTAAAAVETAVFTCVTDGKIVEVFAHHFENGQYHQNLVARESLLLYPNRGRELIRNVQDNGRRKAYELAILLGANLKEEEY